MARPMKEGLDYFPLDVDFYNDDKIELLVAEFGVIAESILLRLLCQIYKTGYFYRWGGDECLIFCKRSGAVFVPEQVNEVIRGCLRRSIFDNRVFEMFGILTSPGVQKRYSEAVSERKMITIYEEIWLLDKLPSENTVLRSLFSTDKTVPNSASSDQKIVNRSNNSINRGNNSVNRGINPQSKVKESKVKESESKGNDLDTRTHPDLNCIKEIFLRHECSPKEAESFFNYYKKFGFKTKDGAAIKDWEGAAESWIEKGKNVFGKISRASSKEITEGRWKIMIGEIIGKIPAEGKPLFLNLTPIFHDEKIVLNKITSEQIERLEGQYFEVFKKYFKEFFPKTKIEYKIYEKDLHSR